MVQSVERPTSAQSMISQFVGSSPESGSVLTHLSLEPASHSVSPSLPAPPPLMFCLSLSKISKNVLKNILKTPLLNIKEIGTDSLEFLNLSTVDSLGQIILCCWGLSWYTVECLAAYLVST